jgi:hypothetical protein
MTDLEIPVHPRENLAIGAPYMARRFSALVLPRMLSSFDSYESFWPFERAHAGTLDGADVHEHVVAAIVGLNEAKALGRVEPLNCSGSHLNSPRCAYARGCPHDLRASLIRFQRCLGEWSRFGAINKANRLFELRGVYATIAKIAS